MYSFHSFNSLIHNIRTTFWFGDLNYRIIGTEASVKDLIKTGDLENLFKFDQVIVIDSKSKYSLLTYFLASVIIFKLYINLYSYL